MVMFEVMVAQGHIEFESLQSYDGYGQPRLALAEKLSGLFEHSSKAR